MDATTKELLTLKEAAKLFPLVNGKPIAPYTIRRWHCEGANGVHLAGRRMGRRFFTTREDVQEFIRAQAGAA